MNTKDKLNSNVPSITLIDANNNTVIAYELQSVVDNVKSKALKYVAGEGITTKFIAEDNFDKRLKHTLDYNPNK